MAIFEQLFHLHSMKYRPGLHDFFLF